jgi:hypothetical protein
MRIRNRFKAFLGVLIIALGGVVAVQAPASAHPYDGCGHYHFCIQTVPDQSGFTTYSWNLSNYVVGACVNIGWPHDNTAKATFNRHTWKKARVYTGSNCTGNVIVYSFSNSGYGNCANINYYSGLYRDYWDSTVSSCASPNASSFQVSQYP